MYRFLLTPKWVVGHVLLVVTVVSFVNLGFWQLRRLDERREHNALIEQRLAAAPVPLDELLRTVGSEKPTALDFRRVVVTGRYRPNDQLLTAPRSRDGRPGPQVLTVLHRDGDGGPVLVDRGWIPFDRETVRAPPAPAGQVRIEGVVRAPEEGAIGDAVQVARIVPEQIGARIGQPLPAFYVQLWEQRPPLGQGAPLPGRAPVLSEGNHLSYALQWFSFTLIALIGYPVLVRRTARERSADGDGSGPAREERPARMPIR